jgi:hypothetical protein
MASERDFTFRCEGATSIVSMIKSIMESMVGLLQQHQVNHSQQITRHQPNLAGAAFSAVMTEFR